MSSKLFLFPDPDPDSMMLIHDAGINIPAVRDTHPTGRLGWSFTLPDTLPNGHGALIRAFKSGYVLEENKGRLFLGGTTFTLEQNDAIIAWDDFRLIPLSNVPPNPIPPSDVVGCVNHRLTEPDKWFFNTIQRKPGMPANDYKEVLLNSGIPEGNAPGVRPNYMNGYYGFTQQMRRVGGKLEPAGRIFAPTETPDENNYYAHPYSPLADAPGGGLMWEFRDLGGPPYVAGVC